MNGWLLAPKVVLAQAIQARHMLNAKGTESSSIWMRHRIKPDSLYSYHSTTAPQQLYAQRRVKGRTRTLMHMEIAIKISFFKTLIVQDYKDDRHK